VPFLSLTLPPFLPPSFPTSQCFINGEFVGGSDILLEMYESGELEKTLAEMKK
jgi:glutaredoxin-related protein